MSPDRRILAEGYEGATWPIDHYHEIESLEERWQPYVYFRPKPFHGKTIVIGPEGLRTTWQPTAGWGDEAGKKTIKVLMLGGSSLWGFGARDDQTIPSLLARKFHERGLKVEIKNLAELGYVSTQEMIGLICELQHGYRPDVVIFYDGVNDTTSAVLSGAAGLTTNEINRRREFNLLQSPRQARRFIGRKARSPTQVPTGLLAPSGAGLGKPTASLELAPIRGSDAPAGRDVVDRYVANIKIVETLARGYGFRPLFFWQPTIFNKTELTAAERDEAQKFAWTEPAFRAVYETIEESSDLKAEPGFS